MRNKIEFEELSDDFQKFEDLVADYFREIQKDKIIGGSIKDIEVRQSGKGADGGRDILIIFQLTDSVINFERKWVIQCKFYKDDVSKSHLSDVNIPSLIHEYKADGYLLVCRKGVNSSVTNMFDNLRKNCRFGYGYEIWKGGELKRRIRDLGESLIQTYFPEHFEYLRKLEQENNLEDL
jgi:Restriction endonuclease